MGQEQNLGPLDQEMEFLESFGHAIFDVPTDVKRPGSGRISQVIGSVGYIYIYTPNRTYLNVGEITHENPITIDPSTSSQIQVVLGILKYFFREI